MQLLTVILIAGSVLQGVTLSGRVVDTGGHAVSGARVFVEPGLTGALREATVGQDGSWRVSDVSGDNVGVFAMANGFAFGGATVRGGNGDVSGLVIRLGIPAVVSGKMVDPKGHPVKDVYVTRVGLLGDQKVGIPLMKLKQAGVVAPVSGEDGRFTVTGLPEGGKVALKFSHADYAQEATGDVAVGTEDLKVVLYQGLLVRGSVVMRQKQKPVAEAVVLIKNATPPNDTTTLQTDMAGTFSVHLKPGVYMCQAVGMGFQSPGWMRLTLTGETVVSPTIYVGAVGTLRGKVLDAKSGNPVAGARLELSTEGNMAAVAYTGADGLFTFNAMAGQNVVRLDAAPGYLPPEQPALTVKLNEEQIMNVPDFWLVPSTGVTVQVVDSTMKPVSGAATLMLQPAQFGWRITDGIGKAAVALNTWPAEGTAVGFVEHTDRAEGALFALKRDVAEAKVQLFPLGRISGHVVNEKGEAVEGVAVAGLYGQNGVALWRTVTDRDGVFNWTGVVPQVPQAVSVYAGEKSVAQSEPVSLQPGETKMLSPITLSGATSGISCKGRAFDWRVLRVLTGPAIDKSKPAVILFCSTDQAAMAVETLSAAKTKLGETGVQLVVAVNGSSTVSASAVSVLSGKAPGTATTYIVGGDGNVLCETFGLPPIRFLRYTTD